MAEWIPLLMFLVTGAVLMTGYPVALSLGGTALAFAVFGSMTGSFDDAFLSALPSRLFGIMTNETLIAVPLFVFMGVMLERAKIAEQLLDAMSALFGRLGGGLGISVVLVGMLMAASTGIVGATVVTMGLRSLPTMLKHKYDPAIACGTICASGTLGQIIPPSIVLVLLGDVLSSAYQQAQLDMGIFSPETVSVGDLFAGALIPGLVMVALYVIYLLVTTWLQPHRMPSPEKIQQGAQFSCLKIVTALAIPMLLILAVLGSILSGLATPTEAASVGAVGAILLAAMRGEAGVQRMREVTLSTMEVTSMVFMILIGASLFSLVFRGFGGDEMIADLLSDLPGGAMGAMVAVMLTMFLLGFILDFIEITFVIVPIVGPILLAMGIDPVWLGIMIAINLQTSFLTPPFGFALFYLRGVAPASISTSHIYRGVMPYIAIQLLMLVLLAYWPMLATWLPGIIYG